MENTLDKLEKLVEKELDKITAKGDITPIELEMATKAVCLMEKIKMVDDINSGYNYSNDSYRSYRPNRSNTSYRDNYSQNWDRDYSMERGYSGHSVRDRMISHLESTMMDNAQSDNERRVIESLIGQLETGNR